MAKKIGNIRPMPRITPKPSSGGKVPKGKKG